MGQDKPCLPVESRPLQIHPQSCRCSLQKLLACTVGCRLLLRRGPPGFISAHSNFHPSGEPQNLQVEATQVYSQCGCIKAGLPLLPYRTEKQPRSKDTSHGSAHVEASDHSTGPPLILAEGRNSLIGRGLWPFRRTDAWLSDLLLVSTCPLSKATRFPTLLVSLGPGHSLSESSVPERTCKSMQLATPLPPVSRMES